MKFLRTKRVSPRTSHPNRPYAKPRSRKTLILGPAGDTIGSTPTYTRRRAIHKKKVSIKKRNLPQISRTQFVRSLSIFVLAFIVISSFLVVFSSDTFRIRSQKISLSLVQEDLFDFNEANQLLDTFVGELSFLVGSDKVFDLLTPMFPQLRQVDVSVRLPDGISVSLRSFEPRFRTILLDSSYLIVENGALVPESTLADYDVPFLTVVGRESRNSLQESYLLTFAEVQRLTQMIAYFGENSDVFPSITGLAYYYTENEVHVFSGSRILLMIDGDPIGALENLKALESESFGGYLSESYTYLDLRVAGRLFACPGQNQTSCEANLENMYGANWEVDQTFTPIVEEVQDEEVLDVSQETAEANTSTGDVTE